ncbi:hypothetical protein HYV85_03430 [Candidatus Woesearchaeota archaeon]|nr:hypothetical protein [Candidatus Woesearchaeota archaeon]
MTLGNPQAHKRLGELINELRKLEHELGLPSQHVEIFRRAVNVLSELEAEMGAQAVPAAEATHSPTFSPQTYEAIDTLRRYEDSQLSYRVFSLYFEAVAKTLPFYALQAAKNFKLDALAIITGAEKALTYVLKRGIEGDISPLLGEALYEWGRLEVKERIANGGAGAIKRVTDEAFGEAISKADADAAMKHYIEILDKAYNSIGQKGLYTMLRIGFFLRYAQTFARISNLETSEEKIGYNMFANALVKFYMYMLNLH